MLSLLNKYPEDYSTIDISQELCLDQIVERICRSKKFSESVLAILQQPLRNPANIIYRQEICQDFIANDGLFMELNTACHRYLELKTEWEQGIARLRTQISMMQFDAANLDMIRDVIYTLETNASYSLKITSFPESLHRILNKYNIKSEGLITVKDFCNSRINNKNYTRLREIAQELSKIATMIDKGCEITIALDDSFRCKATHLIKVKKDYQTENTTKRISLLGSIFGQPKDQVKSSTTVPITTIPETQREMVVLIADALKETSSLLAQITKALYPAFAGLSEELVLYDFVLRLNQVYNFEKIPQCFPDIKQEMEDIFQCEELYDSLLLVKDYLSRRPKKNVVPNDVLLNKQTCGILIQGDNSSGKTTFLRAIGIAQVFAQAGLPIPAKAGTVSIRRRIFAHFSSEDQLATDDVAGRFEGEVKEIATIIDQLEPYSLILLNETFQTTAFDEATQAIFDILDVISEVKVKWVFVTHLLQISPMFSKSNKQILQLKTCTTEGRRYKLKQMDEEKELYT